MHDTTIHTVFEPNHEMLECTLMLQRERSSECLPYIVFLQVLWFLILCTTVFVHNYRMKDEGTRKIHTHYLGKQWLKNRGHDETFSDSIFPFSSAIIPIVECVVILLR